MPPAKIIGFVIGKYSHLDISRLLNWIEILKSLWLMNMQKQLANSGYWR